MARFFQRWVAGFGFRLTICLSAALFLFGQHVHGAESFDFFEQRIRPVLIERCYKCHSAESEKLKGGLLLDSRAGMLKGGESGKPSIVPGDPGKSQLIEAIRYQNEELQMPPKQRLSEEQVADFVAWIESGALDPRVEKVPGPNSPLAAKTNHWAFQPPRDHPIPKVKQSDWPRSPIDFFVLSKLEEHALAPTPPADKRTLLRRATYDLTGLPPTLEEIDAFVKDESVDAFAKVVDRLLASPRYGERWGRYWLDVARYADTKGYVFYYEESQFVQPYRYRDWVIRAFNEDMPYDQFLIQQIAADQLALTPEERADKVTASTLNARVRDGHPTLAAMGFLTLGRRFLGNPHDIMDDQLDVVIRGTQALTIGCARCHDHKFDPIPTQDYYSLYGVFQNSTEKVVPLDHQPKPDELVTFARAKAYVEFEQELQKRTAKLDAAFKTACDQVADRLRGKCVEYLAAVTDRDKLPTLSANVRPAPDDINPYNVRQWDSYLSRKRHGFDPVFAPWFVFEALPRDRFQEQAEAASRRFAASSNTTPRINLLVAEAFSKPPGSMKEVAERYGKLFIRVNRQWRDALESATATQSPAPTALPDPAAEDIRQLLYAADSPVLVPPGSIVELDVHLYFDDPNRVALSRMQMEIEQWLNNAPSAPPHAVVLEERPSFVSPVVFRRGDPSKRGEEVPRQFLGAVAGESRRPFAKGSGRLELAQAIASPENPLTARVMANRVWLHHFGAGLVRTPSDFGLRSEPPSHPELLDWLARRFIADGWSLKKLHRLMMLSATYQQACDSDHADQIDPENRWLSHMNRRRLDFEAMRDSLLAVTGELDLKMGGPALDLEARPFAPRRSVYGRIDRKFIPAAMRAFDFANPDIHTPQRFATMVPQQALYLMNGPFLIERAKALAHRAETNSPAHARERAQRLYEFACRREPTAKELELSQQFITSDSGTPPPKAISPWQYGFGEFDETTKRVVEFRALPSFKGGAWRGGDKWPDPKLGSLQLTADGGHAGDDHQHAAIRRWVAPWDGVVAIEGLASSQSEEANSLRARIISSRQGERATWSLRPEKVVTQVPSLEVSRGDTIDFAVEHTGKLDPRLAFKQDSDAGILRIDGRQILGSDPNHLLFHTPGYAESAQEILARVRVLELAGGGIGRCGIAVVTDTNTSRGVNLLFRDDGPLGRHVRLQDDYVAWGPEIPFNWRPGEWTWLRLRHTSTNILAKVWTGDGSSAEPSQWNTWQHASKRTGLAGITAPHDSASRCEVDYILIKAAGLPRITVAAQGGGGSIATTNLPEEFGQQVNGFQDDFRSATRNAGWQPAGKYAINPAVLAFKWAPTIKIVKAGAAGTGEATGSEWNSKRDFSGPTPEPPPPLTVWEQLAQVLLLSNEFMFVD